MNDLVTELREWEQRFADYDRPLVTGETEWGPVRDILLRAAWALTEENHGPPPVAAAEEIIQRMLRGWFEEWGKSETLIVNLSHDIAEALAEYDLLGSSRPVKPGREELFALLRDNYLFADEDPPILELVDGILAADIWRPETLPTVKFAQAEHDRMLNVYLRNQT